MNLLGKTGVYQKGQKSTKGNKPTQAQYARFERIRELGCSVCGKPNPEVHHAETGGGGRKDHNKVFALCVMHHRSSSEGLHGMGRKAWEAIYGTEQEHLERVKEI